MSNDNEGFEMKKKFKMPSRIKNYKIEKELCVISNGHICEGNNININEKVLIKIYDKELIQYYYEELSLINNEIFMLRLINHIHCLKLYEIIESPSYIFLIMEYFNGTRLVDYMKQKKKLSEDEALNIYKQILSVLVYLHDMNIGHLNISANNIFIDNTNNIKIFEFKYSLFYSSKERVKCEYMGDKLYLSPELCSKKSCFPELSDIWSAGVILYLLAVGEHPFFSKNDLDSQKLIMRGEFKLPTNMSKIMQDFFKTCFEIKEESRYNIERIFNCSLLRQKKIVKETLTPGFNVLSAKYPIDQRALIICKNYFNLDTDEIKQKLYDNVFDPQTSLYKQIISKFTSKKVSSDGDFLSKKYNNYINNNKYYFDEKIQKKNIQNSLNKELDIKQMNKLKEKEIVQNQEASLIKLDDLLTSYNEFKKNPDSLKKRPKPNRSVEEAKKKAKLEEEEKQKEKLNEKDKGNSTDKNKESGNIGDKIKKQNSLKKNKNQNENEKSKDDEDMNGKISKKPTLKIKDNNLEISRKNSKRNKSFYNKKSNENISQKIDKDIERKNSIRRTKSFHKNKFEKEPLEKEEPSIIRKNTTKSNKSVYQKKNSFKFDEKSGDTEKILRKNSRKNYSQKKINEKVPEKKEIQKEKEKDNSGSSSFISDSDGMIDEFDDNKIQNESKNWNLKKSKNHKKVSFQAQKFNFMEKSIPSNSNNRKSSLKERTLLLDKKPNLKEGSSADKRYSLRVPVSLEKEDISKDEGSIFKKPSLKLKRDEEKNKENENKNKSKRNSTKNLNEKNSTLNHRSSKKLVIIPENENKQRDNDIIEKETDLRVIRKQLESKYAILAIPQINVKNKKGSKIKSRKSVNINNMLMFKNQLLNKTDIKKDKSKDDNNSIKYYKKTREILEEDNDEIISPKFKKKNEKEENEKKNNEEDKKKLKKEEEKKNQNIDKEKIKKEEDEKEKESKKREEEERKKLKKEEKERKRQEMEEEDKRKEKEYKIRKEKEKERQKKEDDDKIKKWKEEARKKKENEEKKKKAEEDRIKKQEEEERKKRKEENERKRLLEDIENQQRLEEYQNKQKEEENKRKNRENLKKQKEEELRQKREKDAKERRNKFLKKDETKKNEKKQSIESDSYSSDEDDLKKKLKTEPNKNNKKNKKTFTFNENPFDKFKKNDSDDEDFPIVRKKSKKKPSKTNQEITQKKLSNTAKFDDFRKFRESDKIMSESGEYDSSEEEKKENNKKDVKPEQNKSIETKKKKKNSLYYKFNDYFFEDINKETLKNQKSKNIKDKRESQDKNNNKKKGFYHYQNNPKKDEKDVVSKKFEKATRKNVGDQRQNIDNNTIEISKDNIKRKNENKLKNKNHLRQNSNINRNDNETISYDNEKDLLALRMKRGRNKNNQLDNRQNNSAVFNHDINNTTNVNNDKDVNKSKVNNLKNNEKKIKIEKEKNKKQNKNNNKNEKLKINIVQNLMMDFEEAMNEYTSIYDTLSTTTKGAKALKGYKPKHSGLKSKMKSSKYKNGTNSQSKLKSSKLNLKSSETKLISDSKIKIKESINDEKKPKNNMTSNNNSLSQSVIIGKKNKNLNHNHLFHRNESNKINSYDRRKNKSNDKNIKEKNSKIKNKKTSNISEFNLENFNHVNSNIIKIKKNSSKVNNELKEEELALYQGQIDYNNVSIKSVDQSIKDLLINYKIKGYTLLKKSKAEFVFVKGPNTHYVELMKLGNGLLYFCVTK